MVDLETLKTLDEARRDGFANMTGQKLDRLFCWNLGEMTPGLQSGHGGLLWCIDEDPPLKHAG